MSWIERRIHQFGASEDKEAEPFELFEEKRTDKRTGIHARMGETLDEGSSRSLHVRDSGSLVLATCVRERCPWSHSLREKWTVPFPTSRVHVSLPGVYGVSRV